MLDVAYEHKDVVSVLMGSQCSGHTVRVNRLVTEPFQKDVKLRTQSAQWSREVWEGVPEQGAMSSVSKDG